MGQWRRLGLLFEGPDMAGHCQSAGGWNRTGTWTGDLLHTTLNTDPKESTLTTGHQLQSVFKCEGADQERYIVVRKMQFIHTSYLSVSRIIYIGCEYSKFIKLEKLSFRDDLV